MKIALIGPNGFIGSRILAEAELRHHELTPLAHAQVDIFNSDEVAKAIRGNDAVVSAYGNHQQPELIVDATRSLLSAVKAAGVKRLIAVGGAGSLEIAPGVQLMDAPGFPEAYLREARAQGEALRLYRAEREVDWTFASPATEIAAGARTGKFRTGGDALLTDAGGVSRISAEDFAIAIVDELERPQHVRSRFSAAY